MVHFADGIVVWAERCPRQRSNLNKISGKRSSKYGVFRVFVPLKIAHYRRVVEGRFANKVC
jgi:hypothetical protein